MKARAIICGPLVLLALFACVMPVQAQSAQGAWIVGRWAAEMKVNVPGENFTYRNMNCDIVKGDHVEFLQSGDIIEAWCGGSNRTKAYGLRVMVSGGGLQWQRLGGMTFANIPDRGNWMPVYVNVSNGQRMVTATFPGYQEGRQDRTVTITLTRE